MLRCSRSRTTALIGAFGTMFLVGCGGSDSDRILRSDPVKYTALQTFSAADLTAFMQDKLKVPLADPAFGTLPDATLGGTYYKVTYSSKTFLGEPVTVSGAVAIPTGGAPKGLVVYMHGTSLGQNECPSAGISGPTTYNEGATAIAAFLSGGYAVAMPDYLGQGVNTNPHPYVMGSKNSPAGRDIALAAFTVATGTHQPIEPKVFVAGYSEGGQNAMALCHALEADPIPSVDFTAAAPMSGPYDLSGAQRQMLMGPIAGRPDKLQYAPLMLVGDIAYAANSYYNIPPGAIFKKNIASKIPTFFNGSKTTADVLLGLLLPATLDGFVKDKDGNFYIAAIMQPAAAKGLSTPDPSFPMYAMLKSYDTYNWKPTVPMYLTGLTTDTFVSFGNTQSAVKAMRANGVTSSTLGYHGIVHPDLNHLSNIGGSCILARKFFDGGFAAVPTDSDPE